MITRFCGIIHYLWTHIVNISRIIYDYAYTLYILCYRYTKLCIIIHVVSLALWYSSYTRAAFIYELILINIFLNFNPDLGKKGRGGRVVELDRSKIHCNCEWTEVTELSMFSQQYLHNILAHANKIKPFIDHNCVLECTQKSRRCIFLTEVHVETMHVHVYLCNSTTSELRHCANYSCAANVCLKYAPQII